MRTRTSEQYEKDRATLNIARSVALKGGALNRRSFSSNQQPYCDSPVLVYRSIKPGSELPGLEVDMLVPCRRCAKCLQFRQMQWKERCDLEIAKAKRTWFVTLTFSPTHLAGVLLEAAAYQPRLSPLQAADRAAYGHVQRWLKRIRSNPNYKLRYFAVYERGEKHGRSHYHLFLHEGGKLPIPKREIESRWPSIVHARLVDETKPGLSSYVTKYATKSLDIKPRASVRYGKSD